MNEKTASAASPSQASATISTETQTTTTQTATEAKPETLAAGASETQTAAPEEFTPHTSDTLKELFDNPEAQLDEELSTSFLEFANEKKLSRDEMGRLLEMQDSLMEKAQAAQAAEWEKIRTDWTGAVKADFPGEKLSAAQARMGALIDEFGSPEVREHLNLTGAGDSPAIFKFLSNLADRFAKEGQPMGGKAASTPQSLAEKIYTNSQHKGAT